VYLNREVAEQFFVDYDKIARDAAAMLRLEAGQNPHDEDLTALVGELSTRSELFRKQWASQDVRFHRSGRKRLRHPAVGQLDIDFEAMQIPSEPGLQLNIYTAPANTSTADGLKLLASWAASQDHLATAGGPRPKAKTLNAWAVTPGDRRGSLPKSHREAASRADLQLARRQGRGRGWPWVGRAGRSPPGTAESQDARRDQRGHPVGHRHHSTRSGRGWPWVGRVRRLLPRGTATCGAA
jgi:MmyB-like transcription regulator ligand binding domain